MKIPYNQPHAGSPELKNILKAFKLNSLAGDGYFTKESNKWIEEHTRTIKCMLTHSCTAALEMSAILTNVKPGDEVIMPSFTFVSTANAFVLRGAIPVFVDIREDTLNINEQLIEQAITKKTKAIVPVHYAGVGCEMDTILKIAKKHNLLVIEDAAQGFMSEYKNRSLGTIGDLGAYSFHETKNIISGEGGALLINNANFIERAEIIREKGTNRTKFFRGQVDKYTWVDVGSSYLPSEMIAAFLFAQLKYAEKITKKRLSIWNTYYKEFAQLENGGYLRRPIVPKECKHNGHIFYLLTRNLQERTKLISYLKERTIMSIFHYIPLHSSPAGKKYSRYEGEMSVTDRVADSLVRLPLFYDLKLSQVKLIIAAVKEFYAINNRG